ncbi:MAG: response regulator [Desulfosalsimonas sp.]
MTMVTMGSTLILSDVYSEEGRGTTVKIYFPRYKGSHMETGREETEDIPANGNGEVVMVVEDEVEVLNLTKTMLESLGYNVLPASSPNKAMELAGNHEGPIDLLITDVIMPEMNGREIADQLKTLYPDISILFMSGATPKTSLRIIMW